MLAMHNITSTAMLVKYMIGRARVSGIRVIARAYLSLAAIEIILLRFQIAHRVVT